MICVVHMEPDGWHGTVVSQEDDEREPPSDEWIVDHMEFARAFQICRGGGYFLAAIPEEALR